MAYKNPLLSPGISRIEIDHVFDSPLDEKGVGWWTQSHHEGVYNVLKGQPHAEKWRIEEETPVSKDSQRLYQLWEKKLTEELNILRDFLKHI